MADKKVEITNEMCRQAQLLIKGGATNKEAASFLGVSPATVSRIRSANYDLFKYLQNTDERRIREKDKKADNLITEYFKQKVRHYGPPKIPPYLEEGGEVPGQVVMELPEEKEQQAPADDNKMIRFLAGKIGEITTKLDKLNDNLCQILRRMDK